MWKFSNETKMFWKLSNKAIVWGIFNSKAIFFGYLQIEQICMDFSFFIYFYFRTNQCFVKIYQQSILLWKILNKANVCGNFPTKWSFLKIFPKELFLWNFSQKTNFHGNFLTKNRENLRAAMLLRCKGFCDSVGVVPPAIGDANMFVTSRDIICMRPVVITIIPRPQLVTTTSQSGRIT